MNNTHILHNVAKMPHAATVDINIGSYQALQCDFKVIYVLI